MPSRRRSSPWEGAGAENPSTLDFGSPLGWARSDPLATCRGIGSTPPDGPIVGESARSLLEYAVAYAQGGNRRRERRKQ
jgi:hypothetical protein